MPIGIVLVFHTYWWRKYLVGKLHALLKNKNYEGTSIYKWKCNRSSVWREKWK